MMENIFRHLGAHGRGTMQRAHPRGARARSATPMTFSTLIIGVAFLPLFTMTGVSGVIFAPMARTYALRDRRRDRPRAHAHAGARAQAHPGADARRRRASLMRALHARLRPALPTSRCGARSSRCALGARAGRRLRRRSSRSLGGEFMPKLEEGNFWIRATLADVDLARAVGEVRRPHARDPPRLPDDRTPCTTRTASTPRSSRSSRSSAAPTTAPTSRGFYNIELFAPLKPFDEWPRGHDEGEAHRASCRSELARRVPRRRLQLLADDQRQRRGGGLAA